MSVTPSVSEGPGRKGGAEISVVASPPSRPLANARGDSPHWFITAATTRGVVSELRMTRYHHFRGRLHRGSRPPSPDRSGREGGGDRAARRLLPAARRIDAHALHRRA